MRACLESWVGLGSVLQFRVTLGVDFIRTVSCFQKIPYRPRVGGSRCRPKKASLISAPSIISNPVSIGVYPYVVFKHTLEFFSLW